MTRSKEDRERRIREVIDAILADMPSHDAVYLRKLLSDPNEEYQVVGLSDPTREPLLEELMELRKEEFLELRKKHE